MGVQALRCAKHVQVQASPGLGALDGGVLDVVALEGQLVGAGGDGVLVDEIAVLVVEHRHVERAGIETAAQAGLIALAFFRFQIGVGFYTIARVGVLEAAIESLGGRGAETFGVLAVPGVLIAQGVGHAELR
ncbi:hypothetical protein D3C76_1407530 [compost metagenome]